MQSYQAIQIMFTCGTQMFALIYMKRGHWNSRRLFADVLTAELYFSYCKKQAEHSIVWGDYSIL